MFMKEITDSLHKLKIGEIELLTPPDPSMGDYALPCFSLSKQLKKDPKQIAEDIKAKLSLSDNIERTEVKGPYLNFFINKKRLAEAVLNQISTDNKLYGKGEKKKDRVMLEFCKENTHKAVHVGHLRGTSIGEALSRILKFSGYDVVQANYQGDTGAHVAKWLWCYFKFHKGEVPPEKNTEGWIAGIYVESVKKISANPDFQKEVDEVNKKLESRSDKELVEMWKKSRKWSLDSLEKIYSELDAHFDVYFFEGDIEKEAKMIVEKLVKNKIARIDDGATIIDLENQNLGILVLLRKDGTALYSAKDLALAEKKFRKYRIDKSIYVVGTAQSMYFRQLFATLCLMGFPNTDKCRHLAFSEVRFPHGKMSSRTGDNILYSQFRKMVFENAEKEVKKRHQDWSSEEIMKSTYNIAIAAIKFGMLSQDYNKNIVFDIKSALDFEGETGPYVQYAHARACSIIRKQSKPVTNRIDFSMLKEKEEKGIILSLMKFPLCLEEISNTMRVNVLANYCLSLAQQFNEFYHKYQVINQEESLTDARLLLVDCVRQVLSISLSLLSIPAPDRM